VETTSHASLFEKVGLKHPKVCGNSLPASVSLQYMDSWDIIVTTMMSWSSSFLTLLIDVTFSPRDEIDKILGPKIRSVAWEDIAGGFFHCYTLFFIIVYMAEVLYEANHACRFVVLGTPQQFAPWLFSFNTLGEIALSNVFPIVKRWRDRDSDSWWSSDDPWWFRVKMSLASIPILLYVIVIVAICLFQAPLIAATFWAPVAWPHVTGPVLFLVGLATFAITALITAREKNTMQEDKIFVEYMQIISTFVLLISPFTAIIHAAGFLLYFQGDWRLFGLGFFEGFALPPFSLPQFLIFMEWDNFIDTLGMFLTFDVSIRMPDFYALVVVVEVVLIVIKLCSKIYKHLYPDEV